MKGNNNEKQGQKIDRKYYILKGILYNMESKNKMKQKMKEEKISVESYYWNVEDYGLEESFVMYGVEGFKKIIEHKRFELDEFLDTITVIMSIDHERILGNTDIFNIPFDHIVNGEFPKRVIEVNDMRRLRRMVAKKLLWQWIKHRAVYKKSKPAMWDYLRRSVDTLQLWIDQRCFLR